MGIGTSSPGYPLEVAGNGRFTGNNIYLGSSITQSIFAVAGSYMGCTDHFIPNNTNVQDLGTSTWRWRTLYLVNAPNVSSDRRLKNEIKDLNYGLAEIMKMRPVNYYLKSDRSKKNRIGFIAQELEQVIPEVVETANDSMKSKGVYYTDLIPVTIKAIQEQQGELLAKEKRISILEAELTATKTFVEKTSSQLNESAKEAEQLKKDIIILKSNTELLVKRISEIETLLDTERKDKIAIKKDLEVIKAYLGAQSQLNATDIKK